MSYFADMHADLHTVRAEAGPCPAGLRCFASRTWQRLVPSASAQHRSTADSTGGARGLFSISTGRHCLTRLSSRRQRRRNCAAAAASKHAWVFQLYDLLCEGGEQLIEVESGKSLPNAPVLLATATEAEKGLKILRSHGVRIFQDSFRPISDINPAQTARILKSVSKRRWPAGARLIRVSLGDENIAKLMEEDVLKLREDLGQWVEDGHAQSAIAVVNSEQWDNLVSRGIDLSGGNRFADILEESSSRKFEEDPEEAGAQGDADPFLELTEEDELFLRPMSKTRWGFLPYGVKPHAVKRDEEYLEKLHQESLRMEQDMAEAGDVEASEEAEEAEVGEVLLEETAQSAT